jgi:CubicO group peptidase (beta-lactamase class C family)
VTRVGAFLVLVVALAGCGGGEAVSPPPGMETSLTAAQREGFDPGLLRAADRELAATPALGSVLVQRHGQLVFERYYHGATAGKPRNVFSVTKSVVSALVGIAIRDGGLESVDQRLVDFFPGELNDVPDPRIRRITLRHLLTMTAGYHGTAAVDSEDWVRLLLNRPLESDPGREFFYDDGSAHLLSAVLTKVTHSPAEKLADRKLFAPLGIAHPKWQSDGQGNSLGSTGLLLRSRDLLRLGELYLRQGRWRGRQLVPAAWVGDSTSEQIAIPGGYAYGYLWWINTGPRGGFLAQGYAGQMIAVFPRLDLVAVLTGGGQYDRLELVGLVLRALDS